MIFTRLRMGSAALLSGALIGVLIVPAAAQETYNARSSAPTGTEVYNGGNPNCPPPVINGITPKNWSCKTGEGSSYILPQTTSVQGGPNYGPPGSYLQPQPGPPGSYLQPEPGPPGSYLQKDVGPPGSYLQPDVGPPGSYLNSTAGGTQVRTAPTGAIILSPGAPANAKDAPKSSARDQTPTPGVTEPFRQDTKSMQPRAPDAYNSGPSSSNNIPYRQDTPMMQPAMQGSISNGGYSFGPQNSGAQAAQGLANLIGAGVAQAAAAKAANAKSASAKKAAAANAQAAKVMNGFIKMLGTEPGAP
jgi:hypothetical protein